MEKAVEVATEAKEEEKASEKLSGFVAPCIFDPTVTSSETKIEVGDGDGKLKDIPLRGAPVVKESDWVNIHDDSEDLIQENKLALLREKELARDALNVIKGRSKIIPKNDADSAEIKEIKRKIEEKEAELKRKKQQEEEAERNKNFFGFMDAWNAF